MMVQFVAIARIDRQVVRFTRVGVHIEQLLTLLANFGPCGEPECVSLFDCDDKNPCTIDLCVLGVCQNIEIPGCDQP